MKKTAEVFGLPVISVLQGMQVGMIRDTVVDPVKKDVAAFVIKDSEWFKSIKVLPFNFVKSIGKDAVVIDKADQVMDIASAKQIEALARQGANVIGSKVVTIGGKSYGRVTEYTFDEVSGSISQCEIEESGKPMSVPIDKVITLGKDLLVIAEEGEEALIPAEEPAVIEASEPVVVPEPAPEPEPEPEPTVQEAVPSEEMVLEETPTEEPASIEPPVLEAPALVAEELAAVAEAPAPPVEETSTAPAPQEAPADIGSRQSSFLVGKTVTKDIVADDGTVIISAGQTISEEVIQKAKDAKKFLMLSFWVER